MVVRHYFPFLAQVYGSVVAGRYSNQHILPLAHMVVRRTSKAGAL